MSCAPAWLPSQHVRLVGASSGQRHGVRASGAYGRALPSVSMNAQHSQGYRARYGARASACRRASPSVSVNEPNFNPESVCGARRKPALHRIPKGVLRAAVKAKPYGVEQGIQAACRLPAERCALASAHAPCKGCAAWTG